MGEKSDIKRKHILDKARTVFSEKGFKSVTMKDIVDGHTPTAVEEKTITVEKVDEMATEIVNQQNAEQTTN